MLSNRISAIVMTTMIALALGACRSEPYCLNCVDGSPVNTPDGSDGSTDGSRDGGSEAGDSATDSGPDVMIPDGCTVGAEELCNGVDDNCDGRVDEGFDLQTNARHCGMCGRACNLARAIPVCVAGACQIAAMGCDTGFFDLDGNPDNGCEYACTPVPGATGDSTCDARDDDCDGRVDEDIDRCADPRNCGICGRSCTLAHATSRCGRTTPGSADACDATNTRCEVATCEAGFFDIDGTATNGCEYECTASGPETCDGRDNDCDGMVDEGNPGGGVACGSDVGACSRGTTACVMGRTVCMGEVVAAPERCDALDNDCDGMTDEDLIADTRIGAVCGSGIGECRLGRTACVSGAPACMGAVGATTETCDGRDNNCDGMIDNGIASAGPCGSDVGVCAAGMLQCVGGAQRCMGAVGATAERCNGLDDDCNGVNDNGFDLANDSQNCGACGTVCPPRPNATVGCRTRTCQLLACQPGFYNIDGNAANGCEYACMFRGTTEACNGLDDDCDGMIDESVTVPTGFCRSTGLCAGATASCMGTRGFVCSYPATVEVDPTTGQPVAAETRCDGVDNNCNGAVDESFTNLGLACSNGGIGACGGFGTFVCNAARTASVCNAPPVGAAGTEVCDGRDNDCDGLVDEDRRMVGPNPSVVATPWVNTSGTTYVMQYEASRPDATASTQGISNARACARPSVLPWTSLTAPQAQAACAAMGARLCTANEWEAACLSSTGACAWSYNAPTVACGAYSADACNGVDNDIDTATAGVQNGILPTGAEANCRSNFTGGGVFDMSGNVKEFTALNGSLYPVRGGAYNNLANGTQCRFRFTQVDNQFSFVNTGFRCCYTGATPP